VRTEEAAFHRQFVEAVVDNTITQMIDADGSHVLEESLEGFDKVHEYHVIKNMQMPVPNALIVLHPLNLPNEVSPHIHGGVRPESIVSEGGGRFLRHVSQMI
jgi:hypothetical protein